LQGLLDRDNYPCREIPVKQSLDIFRQFSTADAFLCQRCGGDSLLLIPMAYAVYGKLGGELVQVFPTCVLETQ
jgi:hypothetical protein